MFPLNSLFTTCGEQVESILNSSLRQNAAKKGQVMILTALTLGGTILGATTIAGLLMVYQIRQTTDLGNSGRAIAAADAGLEWSFYNILCDPVTNPSCPMALPVFTNGSSVQVNCYDASNNLVACDNASPVQKVRSIGRYKTSIRAFEATF